MGTDHTPPTDASSTLATWITALVVSGAVAGFLVWWVYFKTTAATDAGWVALLPAANATFNTIAALSMIGAFLAIRQRRIEWHKRLMLTAVGFSALFLVSYLLYHHYHGDTPFGGEGWIRPVYFAILISHIVLSVAMLPMILTTLTFSLRGQFVRHKSIARWTLPIWLYVSVTGVVIFFVLRSAGAG
ncbi:MAG: DUF420 domain-containing protein [Acidobacteriota bacterium]